MEMLAERERMALEELESGGMARSSDQDEKKVTEEQIKAQRALDFLPSRTQEVEERLEERRGGREASGAVEGKGQEVGLWTGGPVNDPTVYAPPALSVSDSQQQVAVASPLFSEQQVRKMEYLENQAPMLQRRREELRRPQWMSEEEEKARKEEERKEEYRQKQMKFLMMHDDEKAKMLRRSYELQMECNKMEAEMRSFQHENWKIESENNAIRKENELLRQRLKGYEKTMEEGSVQGLDQHGFRTPDEERKDAGRSVQDEAEGAREEPGQERPSKEKDEKQMELMMRMMSSMQKMIEKREESKEGDEEVEAVRNSTIELPKLPEWTLESAPLDLGDWVAQIEHIMGDLTSSSSIWWSTLLSEAKTWYEEHQTLGPLEKLSHKPVASLNLSKTKWTRLDRRVTSLMLAALPESAREEMVATKTLNPLGILSKLMVQYQPGGLSEKGIILKNLESPAEASSLSTALTSLRRWLRWKRRAEELGVAMPDPSVLVKGLNKITRKVLESHKELSFRVSLVKTNLLVESVPRPESVHQLAEHLVAEVEQIVYLDLKPVKKEEPKPIAKRFEAEAGQKGKGYGKGKEEGTAPFKKDELCRFFLTDTGCKKGKSCGWVHQLDDQRRCWSCGAKDHFSNVCPRGEEGASRGGFEKGGGKGKDSSKGISRMTKKEEARGSEETAGSPKEDDKTSEVGTETDVMKNLLEEANKMLKSMTMKDQKEDKMAALQRQVEELRKMKVFRLTKMESRSTQRGLIDSGATNPLRAQRPEERMEEMEKVEVTLATGEKVEMRMSGAGVMVSQDINIEPIIPMGLLGGTLGYEINYKNGVFKLRHPVRGDVNVEMKNGCPQVSKEVALEIIEEIEEKSRMAKKVEVKNEEEERRWLQELVESHPVLRQLPDYLKKGVVETPAMDLKMIPGCNRRKRKVMAGGFVIYTYSGEVDGYTLSRAVKEVGGDRRRLVEVDVKREDEKTKGSHDMLKCGGVYSALLRASLDGMIDAVISSPNCRTRSVLRHYPIEGVPGGGPRPLRTWQEPFGKEDLSEEERSKVEEDDLMMWRSIMLYIVTSEVRRALPQKFGKKDVKLGLEQPADPEEYKPEVVSWWRTPEWQALKKHYQLQEQTFRQSCWGGKAVKPTTFGGNLLLRLPQEGEQRTWWNEEKVKSSKELSRWAPGFVKEVAIQLCMQVWKDPVSLMAMSWSEHVQRGHTPFRRDCQICQEASARGRKHVGIRNPRAGILNLDVSGPYEVGRDVEEDGRFMLIGTYTWLKPKKTDEEAEVKDKEEEKVEDEVEDEEWVHLEAAEELGGDRRVEGEEEELLTFEEGDHEEKKLEEERRVDPEIEVLRVGVPVPGKTKEAVMAGVVELYLQLRSDGYPIHTIHTDQGREFVNRDLRAWMASRGIRHSTNSGEDPKGNGRAERAVQEVKSRVRRLLHAASMEVTWWPMALRFAMETERMRRRDDSMKSVPCFGDQVVIRKRNWRTKLLEATHETTRYLTPMVDAHGHCVLRDDGRISIAPYVIRGVKKPEVEDESAWIAFLEEVDRDALQDRRRIRGKQPVRVEEGKRDALRLRSFLLEESFMIQEDEPEVASVMFKKLVKYRQQLKKIEEEEQEILQTKIVSPVEMVKELSLWDPAIKSEIKSLFEEKEALRILKPGEKEVLEEKCPSLEIVPSKLVITRKAGGRRKVRIVACGNFIPKREEEDVFASGSDAVGVRTALKKGAIEDWCGTSVDIKTAFLNAPLPDGGEDSTETVVLIRPPPLLVRLQYAQPGEWWLAKKAMYGLRQSPRVWGDFRDSILREVTWRNDETDFEMEQSLVEPNMWKIVGEDGQHRKELRGLVMMYVDDALILGSRNVVTSFVEELSSRWELSKPEWLNDQKPVRFLGMDLWKKEEGFFVSQEAYLKDVLRRRGMEEEKGYNIPISKDQSQRLEEPQETDPTIEEVRSAQKATGEAMWLLTRTRPDLMFSLSKMCQNTLKNPRGVVEVGAQLMKYLKRTQSLGIFISNEEGALEVFTDSSFGPGGQESQGTVIVSWGGTPIMWKSGRQTLAPLSTAESELQEGIEGMTMGDSCDVLVMDVHDRVYSKVLKVDNTAAVSLLTESSGSWRTRHLRLRASHLRWRFGRLDWMVEAVPGAEQWADIGTKPLSASRLEELRRMMSLREAAEDEREGRALPKEEEKKISKVSTGSEEKVEGALRLIILAISIGQGSGQEERREDEEEEIWMDLVLVGSIVMVLFYGLWKLVGGVFKMIMKKRHQEKIEKEKSEESQEEQKKEEQDAEDRGLEGRVKKALMMSQKQRDQIRERMMRSSNDQEASASASEDRGDTQVPTALPSTWSLEDQRLRGRGPAFITVYGKKWHALTSCPRVSNATGPLKPSRWCTFCSAETREHHEVYGKGRGEVVHYRSDCPRLVVGSNQYLQCLVCQDMIRRR
eukprot:symbB.v1.2.003425.t1/scaffold183.1/size281544/9